LFVYMGQLIESIPQSLGLFLGVLFLVLNRWLGINYVSLIYLYLYSTTLSCKIIQNSYLFLNSRCQYVFKLLMVNDYIYYSSCRTYNINGFRMLLCKQDLKRRFTENTRSDILIKNVTTNNLSTYWHPNLKKDIGFE
jgi:hypothetical protein